MSHFAAAAVKSPLAVAAPAAGDAKSPLFCPKPRRPAAPLRCHQGGDAGMDLLDLLLSKVGHLFFLLPRPRICPSRRSFRRFYLVHGADVSELGLGRERRAACRRRPRCSAARRRGGRRTRWSTTAGSAWTARPCPCPCRWRRRPCTGRRRRRPCRRAAATGAPAPGSRSSPPRSASRVLTASTAAAAAVATASPPWPRCTYKRTPSNPLASPSSFAPSSIHGAKKV
jgi:hypothetical protein